MHLGGYVSKLRREGASYSEIAQALELHHRLPITRGSVKNWLDNNDWEEFNEPTDRIKDVQIALHEFIDVIEDIDWCLDDVETAQKHIKFMREMVNGVCTKSECIYGYDGKVKDEL